MSIIRPVPRLRPGRIYLASVAAVAVISLSPVTAVAGAPKAHHLVFRLSGPSRQDVLGARAVAVDVRCPTEACAVVASATGKSPPVRTAKVHARIPAGAAVSLSLPLASHQRGRLKAALDAGRSPVLIVKATARDRAGDKVPLSLVVRPFRP